MTTVFRKTVIEKEKLREIILKNPEYIQPDLSFIDLKLGTEDEGIIDFLGVDKTACLNIVNFSTGENADLLISALSQAHWLRKNETLVKRLFFSENVDLTQSPVIMLIGSDFSEKSKSAAKQINGHLIKFIQFQYVISQDQDAIFFEEVFCNKKNLQQEIAVEVKEKESITQTTVSLKSSVIRKETLPVPEVSAEAPHPRIEEILLSPEEIAEFMDFDRVLEREKSAE
ncbi:MAG: hypothetical protein ABII88_07185 [Candidatus Omnitrophota bacterium]